MEVNRNQLRLQVFLFVIIGLLAAATIYVSSLSSQQQRALLSTANYDVAFSAGQASSEFFRFANRVHEPTIHGNAALQREATLRYDIFYSRRESLRSGLFVELSKTDADSKALLEDLDGLIATVDPLIARLDEAGVGRQIYEIVRPFESRMVQLASAANSFGAAKVAESEQRLIKLHWLFSAITAALIATGFLLILLLMWNKRLLGQMHRELQASASDMQRQRDKLTRQNILFTAALNNMSQGLCMFDPEGKLIVANEKFSKLFELGKVSADDGTTVDDIIEICRSKGMGGPDLLNSIFARPKGHEGEKAVGQFFEELRDGRVISVSRQHIVSGGWLVTQEDVTKRRRAEDKLAYLASHDALTGLANRSRFCSALQSAIDRRVELGEPAAVICFSLDRFEAVVDTLGHRFGDLLLQSVAERTNKQAREGNLVSRLGNHEFAVLLKGISSSERATDFVNKLTDVLTDAFELDGHKVVVGVSIGVALVGIDVREAETVLRNANLALHRALAGGGSNCQFYNNAMEVQAESSPAMEFDLWQAFENGQIELTYQPQIDLADYQITGVEALLHWRHPKRGLVSAASFMGLAEDIGLAEPLGAWVLNQACRDAMSWPRLLKVAVQLSSALFVRGDLQATVKSVLDNSGLPADRLEIELNETPLLQESASILELINELKAMKVGFALNGFGAGQSSIGLVRRFPFDKIKIDSVHVSDVTVDPETLAVVQAVAALGNGLQIKVAAEGINTPEQMRLLHLAGCSEGQGHLFSKALTSDEMSALLCRPPSENFKLEA